MRTSRLVLPLLAAALVITPAGAAAASETLGSTLANAPDNAPASATTSFQLVQPTGVTQGLTPTTAGVIVKITLRYGASGADPGNYGFRVLSGVLPNLIARKPAQLADFPGPANAVGGTLVLTPTETGLPGSTPKGIPILPGEHLAITRTGGTSGQGLQLRAAAAGAERRFTFSTHDSGAADYSSSATGSENTFSFVVEPDVDGDGYGDETQDLCPQLSSTHGTCVKPDTGINGPRKVKTTKAKAKVVLTLTSNVAGATFTCTVDGKAKACANGTLKARLKPGKHKITATAKDAFGQTDPTPATKKIRVKRIVR